MNKPKPITKKRSGLRRMYRRWWFWLIGGILVLLTLLLILMPYGIDYLIEYWLQSQGADQARVSNIDFNPFTRRLKLYELDVTYADKRALRIEQATLLFSWSSFLKKRLHVEKIGITGLDLTIEQLPEHRWRIGGITAALLSDQESETFPWEYALSELQIDNGQIQFLSPKATVSLKINHSRLSRIISWRPEQIARFDFSGQINGSELRMQANIAPFAIKPKFNGSLKLSALDLAPLSRLAAPHLNALAGRLNLDVELDGQQTSQTDFRLTQKGRLSLEQLRLRRENAEISDNQLVWNGTLNFLQSGSGRQQQLTAEGRIEGSGFDLGLPSNDLKYRHDGFSGEGKFNFTRQQTETEIRTDSEVHLDNVRLETADWKVAPKSLSWKGTFQSVIPFKSEDFRLSCAGLLESAQFVMNMPARDLALKYDKQSWEGRIEAGRQSGQLQIGFDRKLVLDNILIEMPELTFTENQAIWEGDLQMAIPLESPQTKISSKGRLTGKALGLSFGQTNATIRQDGLAWEGRIDFKQSDAASEIMIDGKTSLPKITVKSPGASLSEDILRWDGIVRTSMPEQSDAWQIKAEGQLVAGLLKLDMTQQNIIFNNSGFVWNGTLGYDAKRADSGISADGKFSIDNLQVNHPNQSLSLLEMKRVFLDGVKAESLQQVNVSRAEIKDLKLLKSSETKKTPDERAALFSLSGARFENVVFSPADELGIDSAVLENAVLYLHHTEAGQWVYISDLENILAADGSDESKPRTRPEPSAKSAAGSTAETKNFGLRIDRLQFAGDSALRFIDETVNPPYSTKLKFTQAVVSDLDNRRPEQPSPLKLAAWSGKYSRVNLQGKIQPFTKRFSMDVTGNIEALELPPLSPYVIDSLGYYFVSGELDADLDLRIILGKLQGKIDLRASNLKVKAAGEKPQAGQSAGLKVPLESALRLLRDRHNNVDLKVPISGDITDPQFSFSDAINQAIVKALSMASLSYLKYMLGPYGVAIGVAELALKAVPGIRLKPVFFEPGSSDLNQDALTYLQQVAAILKDRPNLKVAVCGLATENDRSFLSGQALNQEAGSSAPDAKLLELAQRRAEVVKDHLVSQYEIKNGRIFICKPELDQDAAGRPRAELMV